SAAIGEGHRDEDFAVLLQMQAKASGLELVSENRAVSDGLGKPGK
ncbi:MAG: hypothetical protein IRY92_06845, partial [Dactylosporangium sp.]|nr:hypothetical protein [Dactylosporangium sp.]